MEIADENPLERLSILERRIEASKAPSLTLRLSIVARQAVFIMFEDVRFDERRAPLIDAPRDSNTSFRVLGECVDTFNVTFTTSADTSATPVSNVVELNSASDNDARPRKAPLATRRIAPLVDKVPFAVGCVGRDAMEWGAPVGDVTAKATELTTAVAVLNIVLARTVEFGLVPAAPFTNPKTSGSIRDCAGPVFASKDTAEPFAAAATSE